MATAVITPAATMQAAVLAAPGRIELRSVQLPKPAAGEVRVRLEGCGVCASNLPPWEGREWFSYPMAPGALGHEGWGVVDGVGARADEHLLGARVAVLSQHAYAEYDTASADAIVPVPPELNDLPFPAEPLGCAMNIFQRCGIEPGDTVAIVGLGFLGVLLTQLSKSAGASVIGISRRAPSSDLAGAVRADRLLAGEDGASIVREVRDTTGGKLCDLVIEATGKQAPLTLAGELTRERGRLVIAGFHQDGLREVNLQLWNWRGLDVINAHERDPAAYVAGMRRAVEATTRGVIDSQPLMTHRFSLEDLGEALEHARTRSPGFMKAWVTP